MVTITSTARTNLLALIAANQEQDKVGEQLVSGKRVNSVADNAFSFFQSRGLDARVSTLSSINDRLSVNLRAIEQAGAAGKKISTALNTVKGLLDDIKSKGAAGNMETSTVTGSTGATGSIFNRTGTGDRPITTSTLLADATELGANSVFAKAGKNANSLLIDNNAQSTMSIGNATNVFGAAGAGAATLLTSAGGFNVNDAITVKVGAETLNLKVVNAFTGGADGNNLASQAGDGATGNALEVRNIDDLVRALNGQKANGTALGGGQALDNVAATFDPTQPAGSKLKITTKSDITFGVTRSGNSNAALSNSLFGGVAGTTTGEATSKFTVGKVAQDDIIAVKVGSKALFAKVTAALTGPLSNGSATQANDGLSEGTAVEVQTLGDLANFMSGKKRDGITDINTTNPLGGQAVSAFVDSDSTGSKLKLSSAANVSFAVKTGGAFNQDLAVALFGGTAANGVDFSNDATALQPDVSANNQNGTTVAANSNAGGFLANDVIEFRVGPTTNPANQQSLFVKVVGAYSGPQAGGVFTQKGTGLSSDQSGANGPLEVKNIGDLTNALNGLNRAGGALAGFSWNNNNSVKASFDATTGSGGAPATGRFSFSAGTTMTIGVTRFGAAATTASAIFGTGAAGNTGSATSVVAGQNALGQGAAGTSLVTVGTVINTAAKESRLSAAKSYRDTLDSIDRITTDAQVNGLNLLRDAAGFTTELSETATQNFRLRSTVTNAASLGFTVTNNAYQDGAQNEFASNADVDAALTKVNAALNSLSGRSTEIEVQKSLLTERQSFNKDMIESMGNLSTDLTAVNQEEASAQASAASFSSTAALKFLGVSSQRAQQLLGIF